MMYYVHFYLTFYLYRINSKNKDAIKNRIKARIYASDTDSMKSEPIIGMVRKTELNHDIKAVKNKSGSTGNFIQDNLYILNSGLDNNETKSLISGNNIS